MDDLLREFLTETNERLDVVDVELVRFEQDPNNANILANIFRLMHTIKGTCGFLGLPRLEALAHAAETLMGKFRDGMPVTGAAVTLILSTIDRIKQLLDELEREQQEPEGLDRDLIEELGRMALGGGAADAVAGPAVAPAASAGGPAPGALPYQVLERPLLPGEVPIDELERIFRETAVDPPPTAGKAAPARPATFAPAGGAPPPGPT